MTAFMSDVHFFRPRVDGPEVQIEDAVVSRLTDIFERNDWPLWVGGSVPIGAGFPDIVSAWYDPQVVSLADFQTADGHILATRLQFPSRMLEPRMKQLEASAVINRATDNAFSITASWRQILPEVVTVEAKVSDWRAALQQANRNRIFAHRSFVAFPEDLAERVRRSPGFLRHGVGILAVSNSGEVWVSRPARRNRLVVWNYYFHLAALAAKDMNDRNS
jgi:hypothetical protein